MYISGVVEAYISVGTAKVKPINTGVYPKLSKCKAKVGYKEVIVQKTKTCEMSPKVKRPIFAKVHKSTF
jgi:hypothetical protein